MFRAHEPKIDETSDRLSLAHALMLIAAMDRVVEEKTCLSKMREKWLAVLAERLELPLVVEMTPRRPPVVHDATGHDAIGEYVALLARHGLPPRTGTVAPKRASMTIARVSSASVRMLPAMVDVTRWAPYAALLDGAGLSDPVFASTRVSDQTVLLLHRARGGPSITSEEQNLVRLFMSELTRRSASLKPLDKIDELPPRLTATLSWLLRGASEKEIAAELDLSVHTVHQYVKMLYKTYGVGSRAQLMARCLGT